MVVQRPPADEDSEYETDDEEGAGRGAAPRPRARRPAHAAAHPTEELKMVLVVNAELKMGKGKIGEFWGRGSTHVLGTSRGRRGLAGLHSSGPAFRPTCQHAFQEPRV